MNTRLVIGVPSLDSMKTETVKSLFQAASELEVPASLVFHTSCYIHESRNKIVKEAQKKGATHLMFVDSDMAFPPDGISKLLEHDVDIVGGLYFRRQAPHLPTINQLENGKVVIPHKFPTDKRFKAWAVATGFMLIKMSVFDKIADPWFYFGNYKGTKLGEDTYFCWKAGQKGFDIWCDPTIPLGHVGGYAFTQEDFKAYQDLRPKESVPDEFEGEIK